MSINKIEETFTHIRKYWKEEEYKKCELEWKQIQSFINTIDLRN